MNSTPAPRPVTRRQFLGRVSAASALALAPRSLFAQAAAGRKLGVALVGLGGYSTGQLGPALRLTSHCQLTGVVTGSVEKGKKWAADYGFPETSIYDYSTMARLADNPAIDIVYVVTPNGLHAEHAIAAAQAGKHVICEKPMANTVADCDAIIAACQKAGVRLGIGYRLHYDPTHAELRRLARTQEFGPFLKMDGGFGFTMGRSQWRAQKKLAGGGPLMDLGVYVLQEALMASGEVPPVALTARELPKLRPEFFVDVEETIEWTLEFANGARATGWTSYNANRNDFRAEAKDGWYEISSAYGYKGQKAVTSRGPVTVTPPASQQALQMDAFARDVLDGTPSLVPGEMGRRDMVMVEAIYASAAAGGKRVELKF
ncbi:Glucose--fructose oxidoreductase precursor [Lacunisphaera limnophila]|uniref:Glucose--fructose oxidoreductase n=1 Tax=Lacunisphaera limnophila TaxID=1838286 RepID=A0A1D8AUG3_9BACT|nr:Gfo/Idh/MocA family oxidoreductase [Lacunisphaera limnophila]AOS44525.1 Glucose--fructose oxidoreductase precursor [Lacunisphaera limnophila]